MADLLVPGVWWLHETRGSNVYLVEASDGSLVLIDSGFGDSVDGIEREVGRIGGGRKLSQILLTHGHFDHAGAAAALRARTGAAITAGAADCRLDGGRHVLEEATGGSHPMRKAASFVLHRTRPVVEVDCVIAGESEIVPGIVALPVPGHTPGSLCYVDTKRGVAFVGDLVISHRDGLARPLQSSNADEAQYLESLRTFAHRAPSIGCPGHGAPVLSDFGTQLLGLSLLPRSSGLLNPARLRRLLRFTFGMSRRRRPKSQ